MSAHTLTSACKLLLQEGVPLSRSSRWSKLDPNCASHVLSLHSSHRAQHPLFSRNMAILESQRVIGRDAYCCEDIFQNLQTSGLKNIQAAAPEKKPDF